LPAAGDLCRRRLHLGKFLKLGQYLALMLREITHHPRIAEQRTKIAIDQHKIEMIGPIMLFGDPEFTFEVHGLAFHQGDLLFGQSFDGFGFIGINELTLRGGGKQ